MQKRALLIALLSTGVSAIAQPTITSTSNPVNGSTFTYFKCDSVGPGAAGANVTWNFTTLNSTSNLVQTYKNCPGWAECDTFTGSNISLAPDANSGGYYKMSSTKFAWNGEHVAMGPKFKYTNERDVRHYPFTMTNTFNDTHASSFISGGSPYLRTGTITVTADAYGTLQLPGATHTNVLRMHSTDNMHDTCLAFPLTQDYIRDVYEWWAPNQKEYLLHVEVLTILPGTINPNTTTIATVIYTNQFPASVNEVAGASEVRIYPVPAHDKLNIDLGNINNAQNIELTDIVGKTIQRTNCITGISNYQMTTADVPTGIYIIRINTDNGVITRKVEIL